MNKIFANKQLDYIGFPLGGIGAGMFNIEGNGSFSGFSISNAPDTNMEPCLFSAITVKGENSVSRIIESQVPKYKIFGGALSPLIKKPAKDPQGQTKANGLTGRTYGLPRFKSGKFSSKFPFANLDLEDNNFPLEVKIKAWSPFTPGNADDSSYPVAYIDYSFKNNNSERLEAVYYFSSMNFMAYNSEKSSVYKYNNGFVLAQKEIEDSPWLEGYFHAFVDDDSTKVNTSLFRGGWFDTLTMVWNDIQDGKSEDIQREDSANYPNPGAMMSLEFALEPGEEKNITLNCCWYVPNSKLRIGYPDCSCCCSDKKNKETYKPWYSERFKNIEEVGSFVNHNRDRLYKDTKLFSDTFSKSTLPSEAMEAVEANLSIIKSPTILRQTDGRLWCWEGCCDSEGCCSGSCTHVWNYAQSLCNLFPELERGLRHTEFFDSQDDNGHQNFRSTLPIGEATHDFYAAADGQLGGIVKVYREFIKFGDIKWLKNIWPKVKKSLNYCIKLWDKKEEGVLKEPHHNTYDIEFWGADGMCSSFYVAALKAASEMSKVLGEDNAYYEALYQKGEKYLAEKLFNGEYFIQELEWKNLQSKLPTSGETALNDRMSDEAEVLISEEGPKYQYGSGCISDGVIGYWMAHICGLGVIGDKKKILSHLKSVHKYNLKNSLLEHSNPQRPGYCIGDESGLLLCTWPKGGKPRLPFVYSDE